MNLKNETRVKIAKKEGGRKINKGNQFSALTHLDGSVCMEQGDLRLTLSSSTDVSLVTTLCSHLDCRGPAFLSVISVLTICIPFQTLSAVQYLSVSLYTSSDCIALE